MASKKKLQKSAVKMRAEDSLNIAWEYHQAGRLLEAENLYRQIVEVQPESANVLCLLGIAVRQQGKVAEAIDFYDRAIAQNPDFVEAHLNKAHVLMDRGESQRAIASYEQVIQLSPNTALAYNNLGWLKQHLGEIDSAISYYQTALQLDPSLLETAHNLAGLLKDKNQLNEAVACYLHALKINPKLTYSLIGLGRIFQQQGKLAEAFDCYQQAIALEPNNPEAQNNVGAFYHEQGNTKAAISHYRQALKFKPDFVDAINNLAHALVDLGEFQEAFACHRRALELQPDNAIAHLELALTLLLFGDFQRGFAEYEWRWRTSQVEARQFPQPLWDGADLQGKTILLHLEQGFGDSIQFIRYAPILHRRGAKVIVACYPDLMRLFATVAGIEYLSVCFENLPAFDVHAPLMSLPRIVGTTLETIPANVPYLAPPAECNFALASDAKLKVGIVWAGSPQRRKDNQRSCSLSDFMQFLDVPGIAFYSLQKNLSECDRTLLHQHLIPDLSPHLSDFADTASAISQLDLVISVDTSVAHLAGALGKPVWVLLSFAPDWRWLLDREDNPWYPTARLFRQSQPESWQELFQDVQAALSLFAIANSATSGEDAAKNLPLEITGASLVEENKQIFVTAGEALGNDSAVKHSQGIETSVVATGDQNSAVLEDLLQQAEHLMETGDKLEAIALYEQIIFLAPYCFQARINYGFLKHENGELDAAIPHYQEALAIAPNIPQTAYNLAKIFEEQGKVEEAIAHYEQALAAEPDFVPALINLAVALQEKGELLRALDLYRRALEIQPHSWEAYNNLATVLQEQGNLEEALEYYHKALELLPDFVEAINNLGRTFLEKGAVEDAIACYRRAISLSPDHASAHLNLSLALLLAGDLENGLAEYEWRWQIKEFKTGHSCLLTAPGNTLSAREYRPLWDGSNLQGKTVLLHAEQGLGDSLQFIRYVEIVKNRGGRVIVDCYPQLRRLFAMIDGIDLLIVRGEPLPEFDVQVPMLSLPYVLGTRLSTIPATAAYLAPPADAEFGLLPDRNLKVGIVWAGNPKHRKNMQRSCGLSQFLPLLDVSGVTFYSLQKEVLEADRALLNGTPIVDLSPHFGDLADTAAAIAKLDLVITVDTAVAHLAGALGKPVWILLAFSPDWRWLLEREDSPWYPSARLFRQRERGDWEPVFQRVAEALGAVSAGFVPSDLADAELRLGRDLQQQGNLGGAIECYQRAIAIDPNYAAAHSNLGVVKQQSGRLTEAIAHYRQALEIDPNLGETASNLGSALAEAGENEGAIAEYERALSLNPNCAEALVNLGLLREEQGDVAEACSLYEQAIQVNPDCAVAYLNLGIVLEEQGEEAGANYDRAIANYQRAIALEPNYVDALHNLAYASIRQGRIADAIAYYDRAMALQPNLAETLIALGSSLQQQDKLDEALAVCQQAIQQLPANAAARCNLGIVLHKQGKIAGAIACYQQALSLQPDFPEALNNLGKAFEEAGNTVEAIDCYRRAIELKPGNMNSLNGLGKVLHNGRQLADAVTCYSQAVQFNATNPESHLNLGLALLLSGELQRGFSEYEWRLLIKEKQFPLHNFIQPIWDGKDLEGKTILLCPEQGLGDAIQFIRYADLVKQKGGKVIVWCLPHLHRLFAQVSGIDELIINPDDAPDFQVHARLMSLPHILGTTLETIPANVPYLAPPPGLECTLRNTPNLKVGIVWSGNSQHSQNKVRSFPLDLLAKLLDIPGADFYSLQKDMTAEDRTWLEQMPVTDLSSDLHDMAVTAAVISALDLVISVDTSVAHLAGALGKPVWILLCFVPDWRWMLEREDSPWYPSARLFRQSAAGDWDGVLDRATLALKAKISQHQEAREPVEIPSNIELARKQFDRANVLKSQGNLAEAIAYFKNALVLQPDSIESATNLAVTLHQTGDLAEAATYYQRAIEIDPNCAQAQNNLGILLQDRGNIAEAVICFQKAIALNPVYVKALNNLGATLQQQGELQSAIVYFQQALSFNANYVSALVNLGAAMQAKCQPADAQRLYQRAIEAEPNNPKGHYNLGNSYLAAGKIEQAISSFELAISLQPNYVEALTNLGSAVELLGDVNRAISYYNQALALDPNCVKAHFNLGLVLLLTGDLPRGLAEYEWRWHTDQAKKLQRLNFDKPVWEGSDLNGQTILLRCEQGLGDAIQFVRYAAIVRQKGGKVIISCYQELKRLFKQIPGIEQVAVRVEELPDFQVQAPLMSLPHILGTTLDNIPANVPYLAAPPNWQFSLNCDRNFKVGIVWAGSSEHLKDFVRSSDFSYFLKFLDIPGVSFYSLQKEVSADDRSLLTQTSVIDLSDNLNDFADTAAVISQLDLVICVDTAVAHLAGALGKPVWILLSFMPDWRWMLAREDSPWYPTARLFRQSKPGDWDGVGDRIKTALQELIPTPTEAKQSSSAIAEIDVQFHIAKALQKQGNKAAAAARYEQVIAGSPNHAEAHTYLGYLKQENGQITEAMEHYQQALATNPNLGETNLYLGCALESQGRVAEAIDCYTKAIQLSPESPELRLRLAFALLLTGNFQRGFAEYESRWQTQELEQQYTNYPLWDGSDLHGKTILLHPEQGFGDAIHFIRYAPLVKQKGGKVMVACHQSLKRLFEKVAGVDNVVTNPQNLRDFQVQAPLLSLPRILGTTLETIPANIPYLTAPDDGKISLESNNKLKVGIVWAGGPLHRKNHERSCKLSDFLKFLDVPGASFYSLQKDLSAGDLTLLNQQQIPDLSEHCVDFADTAAIISQLDLVICVDTAIAHLAGALGKPVWILLSFMSDWRWMLTREDSPWYPTVRLFRQSKAGDWDAVGDRIKAALEQLITRFQGAGTHHPPPLQIPPETPPQITGIGISWPVSITSGWGIYGMNLTLQLLRNPAWEVALLVPPSITSESINPLHKSLLLPAVEKQKQFQELVTANSDKQISCNFPVLYALGNNLASSGVDNHLISPCQVGVIFFEDTRITAAALETAKKYRAIVAGSHWNADVLRSCGLTNVAMVNQGIDPAIFHPAPKSNLFGDRFVIFSGGKLEYRKGQDIVIAAFKRFRAKHPEALLLTTWHNFWPQYMLGIEQTGNVAGLPNINRDGSLGISQWLAANGLPVESFIDIGLIPNHLAGQILREADCAVFTNRCEGGTNLVAMESMACGIPTILSANTGHLDLIYSNICYPLSHQGRVKPTAHFPGVEGWGESDVEEVVEALEQVYTNREAAKNRGLAAANFMLDWTWEKQVKRFLDVITHIPQIFDRI
ncbi:MAG: tetratricopeptide repeat protein [Microcoleus sp. PH2017_10_PVI_O_A]|uniref:tetratricopeptide repeat protein n=1 Tax=unclassified Microcoleus TaxID=2642155 RepID=UPI001E055934|nr:MULTISPECIES: tetratricopeptide repeat protein [unclassified Microcoleus]TAE77818.1 MAG: tetratricopeptide repeat protein [Oscillatoriales cyanobacterium]MCC3407550.1 tetratricopeptide repeat protein [Microcoleus sp. PH2017_10_PVI_O_A]MCC3461725.1 tetratricopeptide repeat protein [Microcoleus sp. PH2017_11_PCY_U_A]MCC3481496.1 tetratricopeptide repeat protein [Microcoleus sp. PH2017_12_PCY_D_A]MCC3560914.1 tetratricopeptide repeat protein [Microcoleus sp. PH2017_27_LUM_O_A]